MFNMPTTRSKAKQSHIEDFTNDKPKYPPLPAGDKRISSRPVKANKAEPQGSRSSASASAKPAKRKQPPLESFAKTDSPDKKYKTTKTSPDSQKFGATPKRATGQSHLGEGDTSDLQKPIMINRAPVLQLWGAAVTHLVYPDVSWITCLSAGNAISSLCAVSKGKSIGVIEPQDEDPQESRKRKAAKKEVSEMEQTTELQVMGFPLHVKDEDVLLGGKSKRLKEATLKAKFGGDESYDAVRKTMEEALQQWKEYEEDLNKKAFHMYEQFRPSVASGQQGWGRKGELNLGQVESVVQK